MQLDSEQKHRGNIFMEIELLKKAVESSLVQIVFPATGSFTQITHNST
jgi:hypothetical protein